MSSSSAGRHKLPLAAAAVVVLVAWPSLVPAATAAPLRPCTFTLSTNDFNGDGFPDTAVGNPYATVNGRKEAGSVTVLFGDADGRIGEGVRRVLTQADAGSRPEVGDHFGWSVSSNRNQDRCADLVIGSPGEDAPGAVDSGIAQVVRFSPDDEGGPGTTSGFTFNQAHVGGSVETGDQFGASVVLGPRRGAAQGYGFVGAPGEDSGGTADVGAVNAFALPGGIRPNAGVEIRQSTQLVPGAQEPGDRFGATLALGDLGENEPGAPSLFVGTPGDSVDGADGAGSVTLVSLTDGAPSTTVAAQVISQNSPGVPGNAEGGDAFGSSIALGNTENDAYEHLFLVGSPGENVGTARDAGAVNVFLAQGSTITPAGSVTQNDEGLGTAESGDRFGASVAIRSTSGQLAVGAPGEDVGSLVDTGAVSLGDRRSNGAIEQGRTVTLDTDAAPGVARSRDAFGSTLAGLAGLRERVLAAGAPRVGGGLVVVFSDTERYPNRTWTTGSGGIPSQDGRFGQALTGLNAR